MIISKNAQLSGHNAKKCLDTRYFFYERRIGTHRESKPIYGGFSRTLPKIAMTAWAESASVSKLRVPIEVFRASFFLDANF